MAKDKKKDSGAVGITIKTKDKYLPIVKGKVKSEPKDKRWIAVISRNEKGELVNLMLNDIKFFTDGLTKDYGTDPKKNLKTQKEQKIMENKKPSSTTQKSMETYAIADKIFTDLEEAKAYAKKIAAQAPHGRTALVLLPVGNYTINKKHKHSNCKKTEEQKIMENKKPSSSAQKQKTSRPNPFAGKNVAKIEVTKPKSARELAKERKAEESIISTICGNTTPGQRAVSVAWVALASGTHNVEAVNKVVKKHGLKITDGNIDLSNKANLGAAYKDILVKRRKEFDEYLKRQEAKKAAKKAAAKLQKNKR